MSSGYNRMTSIFNSYYANNLERLNADAARGKEAKNGADTGGKEFSRLLADIEKPPQKPQENKGLAGKVGERKALERAALTNLTPEEQSLLPTEPQAAVDPLSTPVESALAKAVAAYTGVKLEAQTVNFSSQSARGPVGIEVNPGGPPKAPMLVSVSREDGGELNQAPPMPMLLSAERQAPPAPTLPFVPPVPELASIKRLESSRARMANAGEVSEDNIKQIIADAGRRHGIDPSLSLAIAEAESSYRPNAVSKDGHASKGIFQLLDSTGKDMMDLSGISEPYKPFDPTQNATLGVGYLRRLHDIFSVETNLGYNIKTVPVTSADHLEKLAIAAFNAGEGNVARAQARARALGKDPTDFNAIEAHLPASTRAYVQKVSALRDAMSGVGAVRTKV